MSKFGNLNSGVEKTQEIEETSTSLLKTSKLNNYLFAFALSVSGIISIIPEKSVASQQEVQATQKLNEGELSSIDSRKIIRTINNNIRNEKFNFTKKELDNLYSYYLRAEIGETTEIFIRLLLLDSYLEILKNGYTVNGYRELDDLIEKINVLSEGKIKIISGESLPFDLEFSDSILVTGKISNNDELTLERNQRVFFNRILGNKGSININSNQLLNIYISDIPQSIVESSLVINNLTRQLLEVSREYRRVEREKGILDFNLTKLYKEKEDLEKHYESELERINDENEKNKEDIEEKHKNELDELREKHTSEIKDKDGIIKDKETEISDLKKQHQTEIDNMIKAHGVQIIKEQNNANTRITNLSNSFNEQRQKLNTEIESLKEERERTKKSTDNIINGLNETIDGLKKELEEKNQEIINLTNDNTDLKGQYKLLEEENQGNIDELQSKDQEIQKLQGEKEDLIRQIRTINNARDNLLKQSQENLRRVSELNRGLNSGITESQNRLNSANSRIAILERENERLVEFDRIKADLELTNETNLRLDRELTDSTKLVEELRTKIDKLKTENQRLKSFETQYEKSNETILLNEGLESTIQELREFILKLELELRNKEKREKNLENSLNNEKTNNEILLKQVESLSKVFKDIMISSEEIGGNILSEELREQIKINSDLTKQVNDLTNKLSEMGIENSDLNSRISKILANQAELIQEIRDEYNKKLSDFMLNNLKISR